MIKALSIHAPYAAGIAAEIKTVECRSWRTDYRGDLLICSSARCESGWRGSLPIGHALAVVTLKDCVRFEPHMMEDACLDYLPEPLGYAWVLDNVRPIIPVPVKGQQRLFNVDIVPQFVDIYGDDLLDLWISCDLILPDIDD